MLSFAEAWRVRTGFISQPLPCTYLRCSQPNFATPRCRRLPSVTTAAAASPPAENALPALAANALTSQTPYSVAQKAFAPLSLFSRLLLLLPTSPPLDVRCLSLSSPDFRPHPSTISALPAPAREALPALAALAAAHACATGASRVEGRLAIVPGTPCPRLHADSVTLRSLATLAGPGTVIVPLDSLAQNARAPPLTGDAEATPEEHDAVMLRHPRRRRELLFCGEGDALFLRGAKVQNRSWERAAVHRSPRLPAWRKRFVIQVDDHQARGV